MIYSAKALLLTAVAAYATTTISGNAFTVIAAAIAATGAIIAALITVRLLRKVQEVHVLVNSQLTDVMQKLELVTRERDELDPGKPN